MKRPRWHNGCLCYVTNTIVQWLTYIFSICCPTLFKTYIPRVAIRGGWIVYFVSLKFNWCFAMSLWCCLRKCVLVERDIRADSRLEPSLWKTVLLCNDVSHWLDASLWYDDWMDHFAPGLLLLSWLTYVRAWINNENHLKPFNIINPPCSCFKGDS